MKKVLITRRIPKIAETIKAEIKYLLNSAGLKPPAVDESTPCHKPSIINGKRPEIAQRAISALYSSIKA